MDVMLRPMSPVRRYTFIGASCLELRVVDYKVDSWTQAQAYLNPQGPREQRCRTAIRSSAELRGYGAGSRMVRVLAPDGSVLDRLDTTAGVLL